MEILVVFLIFGALFGHIFALFLKRRKKHVAEAQYQFRLAQQRELLRDYTLEPDLLRGHDLIASVWFDNIRHQPCNPDLEALVIAAGTAIERCEGRHYDGRPIQRGWMTEQDYQDYFRLLDQAGDFSARYAHLAQLKNSNNLIELRRNTADDSL